MSTALHIHVPYRICLLGEHVDHQRGETLSANIDCGVRMEFTPNPSGTVRVTAADFSNEEFTLPPGSHPKKTGRWTDYVAGVVLALRSRGDYPVGFDGRIVGEFPSGGLSSSAAVEIAYLWALLRANGRTMSRKDAADLVYGAERGFVGVNVGMLDPMTILFADGPRLLHLDYDGMTRTKVDAPSGTKAPKIAVVYSGIRRRLESSPYNTRIEECRAASERLDPLAAVFRDVGADKVGGIDRLPSPLRERARHYFEEIARVKDGVLAWRSGEFSRFAELIDRCGDSCVENFALGTPEMVELIRILRATPGVRAARFTGGGFGGSAICMIDPGAEKAIDQALAGPYAAAHPDCARRAKVVVPGFGRAADPECTTFKDLE